MKRDLFGVRPQQPTQGRRVLLWFYLVALIGVMLFTHSTAFGRYEARRSYQESPLSPLATPLTATLSVTAAAVSPVNTAVGVTAVLTSAITSPLLVTTTEVITAPVAEPTPTVVEPLVATPGVGNQGQVSLLLVGAVLASIVVAIVVVLSRRQ